MSVAIATTRAACATATGTQTITTNDLGGLTPVAALLIVSFATADGTAADHAMFSIGAVTGSSNRWTAWMSDEHLAATSDSYNGSVATKCIRIISPLDGTTDGEADFSAWVSDGITINWTDAPAAAYLLTVVFFAGSDVTAHANSVALGNTVDVAVDITAPGFRPSLVIAAVSSQTAELSLGFIQENGAGTVTQRSITSVARDGQATMQNLTAYRNDAGVIEIGVGGALVWYGEFNTFDSSGFSLTPRTAGANTRTLNYLALSFGGVASTWVGTHTTPTSINSAYADTGPGFKPQFVLLMPSLNEVQATVATDSRAFSWGLSALDADEQYTTVISSEDAATDGNTQSLSDNVAVSLPNHAGALDIEATFVSFDTTGWTLNYSNITATAKLWPALAIQEVSSGVTVSAAAGTLALAGQQATVQPGAVSIAGSAGTLTLAGQTATVVPGAVSVAANAGVLTISGQQATVQPGAVTVAAAVGALALAGQSAIVVAGPVTVVASAGTLALAGQSASVAGGAVTIACAVGTLTLTPLDATLEGGQLPVGRGIVWMGTFESQNEDELESNLDNNPAENSGTFSLSYTTTHAHSGTYAAQLTINTAVAAAGVRLFRKKEIWENLEPYYYSAWYYFPSLPTVGTFFNIFQFKYNLGGVSEVAWKLEANNFDVGAGPQLGLRLVWDAPMNGPFAGDDDTNAGQSFYQGTLGVDSIPIPIGQWVHIECYLEQSEAYDGRIMAWQDGVQVFDVRDIRTKDTGANNNWSVNNYGGDITPNPWTIHIDDMVVSTERSYPYWAMPKDTEQPDATAGIDTLIRSSSATTNFGTSTTIRVGEVAGSAITDRGLFKPDLSGIPAGAIIHSAKLSLFLTGKSDASNDRYIAVYRQKRAWTEAGATWNTYDGTNSWGAAGGFDTTDCEQTEAGQIWLFQAMQVNRRVNIMLDCELVQEWIDGTFTNNGVLLKSESELNDAFIFASSDNATAVNRPIWEIAYTVEASDQSVSATPGALALAGQSATVVPGAIVITAAVGTLALVGQRASILTGTIVNAAAGMLAFAGQTASIAPGAVSVGAQAGTLALSGQTATVSSIVSGITINAAAGTLSLAGQVSTIQPGAVIVVAAIASLAIIGRQASINQGITRGDWTVSDAAKYLWDINDAAKYQWEVIDAARYIWTLTDSSK